MTTASPALRTPAVRTATPSLRTQFGALTMRHVRAMLRQPAYLSISLIQAVLWLPLFGSVFRSVTDIPGFGSGSYISFLTPGVVVMSAFFSAAWAGMGFINDMERGVMDRLLASPARRSAIVGSVLAYQALLTTVQTVIILLLGWALGTDYAGGVLGLLLLLLASIGIGMLLAAFSSGLAMLVRKEESLVAASNFLALPLTFMSSTLMARDLLPGWIQSIALVNPLDWAVTVAREAITADPDWGSMLWRLGALAGLTLLAGWLAARSFRSYQRSL